MTKLEIAARDYYRFNTHTKPYHNFQHALSVVDKVEMLMSETLVDIPDNVRQALRLAALWHDAVYIPCAPYGLNERASESALTHAYLYHKVSYDEVPIPVLHTAARLIAGTSVNTHMREDVEFTIQQQDDHLYILLDADLFSLSEHYDVFVHHQKNIIVENHGDPESRQAKQQSANFLNAIATVRPTIYYTDYARENWEHHAQENIKRWTKEAYD